MAAISGTLQRATAGAFELQVPVQRPWSSMPFPRRGLRHWHRSEQLSAQDQNLEPTPYSTAATQTGAATTATFAKAKRVRRGFAYIWGKAALKVDTVLSERSLRSVLDKVVSTHHVYSPPI